MYGYYYLMSILPNYLGYYLRRSALGGPEFTTNSSNNNGKYWSFLLKLGTEGQFYIANPDHGYLKVSESTTGTVIEVSAGVSVGSLWTLTNQSGYYKIGLAGTSLYLGLNSSNQISLQESSNAIVWDIQVQAGYPEDDEKPL